MGLVRHDTGELQILNHLNAGGLLCCSWMVVDGVVVSKVNFSNQHLRLVQAPSSLMKYKNETHVGPIYLSIIDILSYL